MDHTVHGAVEVDRDADVCASPTYQMNAPIPTPPESSDEYLLTDGAGGYAMGTPSGINARRYHGLLTTALRPPRQRMLILHSTQDTLTIGDRSWALSSQLFHDNVTDAAVMHPNGAADLMAFHVDPPRRARWIWNVGGTTIEKTIELGHATSSVRIQWKVLHASAPLTLEVRPFLPLRSFHAICEHPDAANMPSVDNPDAHTRRVVLDGLSATVRVGDNPDGEVGGGTWLDDPQWWYNFAYPMDRHRGQSWVEHLPSPGVISWKSWESASFEAALDVRVDCPPIDASNQHQHADSRDLDDPVQRQLDVACSQFTVSGSSEETTTAIIAGYPWFADWGRDSMIAMRGLLHRTGDAPRVRQLLNAFARQIKDGLLPNCFHDQADGDTNDRAMDSSLWFANAVFMSFDLLTARDRTLLTDAVESIVESYTRGTRHGIGVDQRDGLVFGGTATSALTWMDAQRDGIGVTPRAGKPIEINALWFNALHGLSLHAPSSERRATAARRMEVVGASMRELYWWPERECLHDVLVESAEHGAWVGDQVLRPNQIFAAALPAPIFSNQQCQSMLTVVRDELLTPFGLRTLEPGHPSYCGRFEGGIHQLDAAYHQGTVWPWLLGPFGDAWLRTFGSNVETRRQIRAWIQPLVDSMHEGCLGQIAEVYDGDAPHRAAGCSAQAWSVAEIARLWQETAG